MWGILIITILNLHLLKNKDIYHVLKPIEKIGWNLNFSFELQNDFSVCRTFCLCFKNVFWRDCLNYYIIPPLDCLYYTIQLRSHPFVNVSDRNLKWIFSIAFYTLEIRISSFLPEKLLRASFSINPGGRHAVNVGMQGRILGFFLFFLDSLQWCWKF